MKHSTKTLPQIPNKRYFTIGEVSYLCAVKPHVLRYWEQEFQQLKPAKRRGNRRYYQREDVIMVRTIRGLLYDEGYTISGARIQLENVIKQQRKLNRVPVESATLKTEQHLSQSIHTHTHTHSIDSQPAKKHEQNVSYSVKFTVGKDAPHVTSVSNQGKKLDNNLEQQQPKSQPQQSVDDKRLHKYKFILGEVITELHDMLIEIRDTELERV